MSKQPIPCFDETLVHLHVSGIDALGFATRAHDDGYGQPRTHVWEYFIDSRRRARLLICARNNYKIDHHSIDVCHELLAPTGGVGQPQPAITEGTA